MITHWYIGFVGESPERIKPWFDIFTRSDFRHVLALAYDPQLQIWVCQDTSIGATVIQMFHPDDPMLNAIIGHVKNYGRWLRVRPSIHNCYFGRWPLTCVSAAKHLLGIRSCALTPKGLYRDLVRKGAQPAFEAKSG